MEILSNIFWIFNQIVYFSRCYRILYHQDEFFQGDAKRTFKVEIWNKSVKGPVPLQRMRHNSLCILSNFENKLAKRYISWHSVQFGIIVVNFPGKKTVMIFRTLFGQNKFNFNKNWVQIKQFCIFLVKNFLFTVCLLFTARLIRSDIPSQQRVGEKELIKKLVIIYVEKLYRLARSLNDWHFFD